MPTLKYLKIKIEEEYHHLSLWYFAFFIFGILTYFAFTYEPSTGFITLLFFLSVASLYFRSYGIIYIFLTNLLVSFILGLCLSKLHAVNINIRSLDKQISSHVTGTIKNIKQVTQGVQIILENTIIPEYQYINKIRLNIKSEYLSDLKVSDRISTYATLRPPPRSIVPGGYDFGLYVYFAKLQAIGYALSPLKLIESRNNSKSQFNTIQYLRRIIYNRLIENLGSLRGNFAAAILLGEGSALDRKVMQNMRFAGISHILCVSGLHLSLVAMLFFISSRFLLNISDKIAFSLNIKTIAAIISLVGSLAYLLLSGMQIAATRAFIMTSIFILSVIIGRSPYPLRSIGIASTIILSLNPEYVLHPSFQLSFIAVLSLITGYEFYIRNQWVLGTSSGIFSNIKLYIFSNIYSSLVASLATTPIVIYHFYISSNYSIIANLVAVPIMSFFMMPLAIIAIILMPLQLDYFVLKLLGFFIQIIIDLERVVKLKLQNP